MTRTTAAAAVALALAVAVGQAVPAVGGDSGNPQPALQDDHPPSAAVAGLDVAPGLKATLFASEPMIASPTNIDIDARGRVWVCDVVNYRHRAGSRPAGDRILILEDTDGDGKADKSTVFYQGRDIDSAMGICVLGNRVIVSVSPNIFVFTDVDGDGKADKKEVLFTKTGRPQHDHSAHKFVFGPDGRLYWNFGNEGHSVYDRTGRPVVDIFGRTVVDDGRPYLGGMAFRCDLDGRRFEVLAHNFRNIYELTVDSFGGLWQSDNDDDGNRSVRINDLLEYGNYGYRDEMTGATWPTPRTNQEPEIPRRHWHQNDPGVVPNLLITGAGAPSGITVYEGNLLPALYRGQLIHCDPGPNVVRAYIVENDGAGHRARSVDILRGTRDNWFRPVDVSVAPDGSLFIADWYDPGVGGHHMGDITRGRIFRVAPPGSRYRVPKFDFSSVAGAVRALQSPTAAGRYLAWTSLSSRMAEAESALAKLYVASDHPRARARALWLLSTIPHRGGEYLAKAAGDPDANIRMTTLRAARMSGNDVAALVRRLAHDPSPQVRRECAIALRNVETAKRGDLWADLATQHNGRDRWYLEGLGIGAEGDWDACLAAWLKKVGSNWNTPAGRDLVWRSRSSHSAEYLAQILEDPDTTSADAPRYLRAFDFLHGPEKDRALVKLAFSDSHPEGSTIHEVVAAESLARLEPRAVLENRAHHMALGHLVESTDDAGHFLKLVEKFNLCGYATRLLAVAQSNADNELGVRAMRALLAQREERCIVAALHSADSRQVENTIRALGNSAARRSVPILLGLADDEKYPLDARRQAVRAAGSTRWGASAVLDRIQAGKLNPALGGAASAALHGSASPDIRIVAEKLFPLPPAFDARPLPSIKSLARRRGNATQGRIVFATVGTCSKCHVVNGEGKDVGPNLSEIGAKLSRAAMYESILFPSAGISHNFATYTAVLEGGNVVTGLLVNRTRDSIAIKGTDAITRTYKASEVEELKEQPVSLMPADLQKLMTVEDLVNVVEYLTTLKPKSNLGGTARVNENPRASLAP